MDSNLAKVDQNPSNIDNKTQQQSTNDGLYFSDPIINSNPSIITIQPTSTNVNESDQIAQISTHVDWVSSTTRSHMSVFSGIYFLSRVEQLEIQKVVDLNSLLGRSINGSQYRVRVPQAETIFLAIENSESCQRTFLRSSRRLRLDIIDPSGETAFVVKKPIGWSCVPAFLHKITIETNDLIGSVEQNLTIIGTSLTVYDETKRPICFIEGPNVYSCCMSSETQFQIISVDRSRQIASLIRHWNNVLVDYSTLLTFTPATEVKLKGLLLGAAFLLEFLFFENQRR